MRDFNANEYDNFWPLEREQLDTGNAVIFSDEVRSQLPSVYESFQERMAETPSENRELQFWIQHFCRASFTGIYCGHRGHWLMPYTIHTRLDSPFTDRRLHEILLSVPLYILVDRNEKLYNLIFKNHFSEFNHIPTGSPLGSNPKGCIPFMNEGTDPKLRRVTKDDKALNTYLSTPSTWKSNFYNESQIREAAKTKENPNSKGLQESSPLMAFVDIETWHRYISKIRGSKL